MLAGAARRATRWCSRSSRRGPRCLRLRSRECRGRRVPELLTASRSDTAPLNHARFPSTGCPIGQLLALTEIGGITLRRDRLTAELPRWDPALRAAAQAFMEAILVRAADRVAARNHTSVGRRLDRGCIHHVRVPAIAVRAASGRCDGDGDSEHTCIHGNHVRQQSLAARASCTDSRSPLAHVRRAGFVQRAGDPRSQTSCSIVRCSAATGCRTRNAEGPGGRPSPL